MGGSKKLEKTGHWIEKAREKTGEMLQRKSGRFIKKAGEREIRLKSGIIPLKAGDLECMNLLFTP